MTTAPSASDAITKMPTVQPRSARRKLARRRVGIEKGNEAGERVGEPHDEVRFLLLAEERHARLLEVQPAGHPPPPDPGEAPAVPVLHAQDDGQHEKAQPDRDRDRDDEEPGEDDQVERHPIASSKRVPSPKYSARGMKCGRRLLHSNRPARVPSAFSPS